MLQALRILLRKDTTMNTILANLLCGIIGYSIGCISPAHLFSLIKKRDLHTNGTGNLGATNATIVFGKKVGFTIMFIDIFKCIFAMKLCGFIFQAYPNTEVTAGCLAIIGHIFPFYLHFKGGKGLAAFGGFVLFYNPKIFVMLLTVGIIISLFSNYSCSIPISASLLFPGIVFYSNENVYETIIIAIACLILLSRHIENIKRVIDGTEIPVTDFFKNHFYK